LIGLTREDIIANALFLIGGLGVKKSKKKFKKIYRSNEPEQRGKGFTV
jgi:hypothetical protein